jgi:metal-responsive CopG/Arc/MetJ family transcriptional regulator
MSMCRRFKGEPVVRLIVTMPADMVAELDQLLTERPRHPARGCRSEFLRLAVAEKLGRELMLSGERVQSTNGTRSDV